MKINKILLLCLLPLMSEVLIACCKCDEAPYGYRFNQMFVYNLDNSGKNAMETSATETGKASYGIRIRFTTLMAAVPASNTSLFLSSSIGFTVSCNIMYIERYASPDLFC